MSVILSVRPAGAAWRLVVDQDRFQTFACPRVAERRGRWLAARMSVAGQMTHLEVYDWAGRLLGVWRDEAFEPAKRTAMRRAA